MVTESGVFVEIKFTKPCLEISNPWNVERELYHYATQPFNNKYKHLKSLRYDFQTIPTIVAQQFRLLPPN